MRRCDWVVIDRKHGAWDEREDRQRREGSEEDIIHR
jgi:hypothetical protein